MRRRKFITLIGGAATWPLAARAQQPAMPVVGFLGVDSPDPISNRVAAFRKGLSDVGYLEGRNVTIEFRWAHNDSARVPELAAELVNRPVSVIAAPGSVLAALAAKAATRTIPIVFQVAVDAVEVGLVASFSRPGGNVTGVSSMNQEIAAKQLELICELMPGAMRFAALVNPANPTAEAQSKNMQASALALGRQIEAAFATLAQRRVEGAVVTADPLFASRRIQLIALAMRHAVPTIYPWRETAEVGGLMSYGSDVADLFRQVGVYTGRVLKGEKPADLPVARATKFELIINLQTARVLGLEVPPTLIARADELIE